MVLGIKENGNIGTMLGLGAFALASLLLIMVYCYQARRN